jgi:hypothetical protein
MVVNCPYKWAECSQLPNYCKCCDKEKKNKQTKKHHTFGAIPKSTTSMLVLPWLGIGTSM